MMKEDIPDRELHERMVLQAIVSLYEQSFAGGGNPGMHEVIAVTGLGKSDVNTAAIALEEAGHVILNKSRGNDELKTWRIRQLGPDARRLARQPTAPVEQPAEVKIPGTNYVQDRVVTALRRRTQDGSLNFDKLLRLVEELNACHAAQLSYASHMLIRAIIDHVPPLFGYQRFSDVVHQHKWSVTDGRYIQHLANFRAQADDALHRQISRESDFLTMDELPRAPWLNTLLYECATMQAPSG